MNIHYRMVEFSDMDDLFTLVECLATSFIPNKKDFQREMDKVLHDSNADIFIAEKGLKRNW